MKRYEMTDRAFFAPDGDGYVPQPMATSRWSPTMVTGTAVCGLLAHASERSQPAGFRPGRITVDLFRPVRMEPTVVETTVVRDGSRIHVVDAVLRQAGEPVARSSTVFLVESEEPEGELWQPNQMRPVPADAPTDPDVVGPPFFGSGDDPDVWTSDLADHQGPGRKRMWTRQLSIVDGAESSPFVKAAMSAETTSLMTNWGSAGIQFINVDLTLNLARLPVGPEIGIEADDHLSVDGIAVGTATLYDRGGAFGKAAVSALANAKRAVQFDGRPLSH